MSKYKFESSERTRQRMSRVHSTNGKDEVILEKLYGIQVLDIEKTLRSFLESRILP